jgi:radical SAM superfamily enzyme YgiQ (UPF0313 family)
MRILLVNPAPAFSDSLSAVQGTPFQNRKALIPPYGVAIIAGLTPRSHEIEIYDEVIRGPVDEKIRKESYDIIGISFLDHQAERVEEILGNIRKIGKKTYVVLGGIGTTNIDQSTSEKADTIVVGEAEESWPRFLSDFEKGIHRKVYFQVSKPDLQKSPIPRWDLYGDTMSQYMIGPVQTTRGCPHSCSYCSVITTFGRKIRTRMLEQVLEEVEILAATGVTAIFFVDDNFSADRHYAKKLLRALKDLNHRRKVPISYLTQVDILVADDDELLQLFADANFCELEIGIESIDEVVLNNYNKKINTKKDIVQKIEKIQSYGIVVMCNFILGADTDDVGSFDRIMQFAERSNTMIVWIHALTALRGTPFWYDINRQGRLLVDHFAPKQNTDIASNFSLNTLTRQELIEGLARFGREFNEPRRFLTRAIKFLEDVKSIPTVGGDPLSVLLNNAPLFFRTVLYFAFEAESELRYVYFYLLYYSLRKGPWMIERTQFLFNRYYYERDRNMGYAKIAQSFLDKEQADPATVVPGMEPEPIPSFVREARFEIINTVFDILHHSTASTEETMILAVSALNQFIDSSSTWTAFDDESRAKLEAICHDIASDVTQVPGVGERLSHRQCDELIDVVDILRRTGLAQMAAA